MTDPSPSSTTSPTGPGTGTAVPPWFERIAGDPAIGRLADSLAAGGALSARGAIGSSTTLAAAACRARLERPVLLVVAHLDEADDAVDDLQALGVAAVRFPALELAPGESNVSIELLSERLRLVRRLEEGDPPPVLVAPIAALMQAVPAGERLGHMMRVLRPGERVDPQELATWLDDAGYSRVQTVESPGEFAVRGGIIDVFAPGGAPPVRLDLFGDELESIAEVDVETMGSDRRVPSATIVGASTETLLASEGAVSLLELVAPETVALLAELAEIVEQGRGYYERATDARGVFGPPAVLKAIGERCHAMVDVNQFSTGAMPERPVALPVGSLPVFDEDASKAVAELTDLAAERRVFVLCENDGEADRLRELVSEFAAGAVVEVATHYLHRGLAWGDGADAIALVPGHELLHRYHVRRRARALGGGRARDAFVSFKQGDYVVHRDHGIAKFVALKPIATDDGGQEEFLTLEFAGRTKLHVPAAKIELVQKYIGAGATQPQLSTIGGRRWKNQKQQAEEAVRDFAGEMLRLQAAREGSPGIRFPDDTIWQAEFEAEFPYDETEDQVSAISATKRDMTNQQPMDRLVCGDVGFGKTEVAMRAAFKAVEYGKQVAVLVPTTVLAEQHEITFRDRFAAYPFRVASLSRFKTKKEQNALLEELGHGRIDIIIGTHRLLSKDVRFKDLGLVVVDEEQRFGVEHKQRLLEFRVTADVMTLSATPIPRTLHMSMLGLRDISSLTTPPLDRRAIVTEVVPYSKHRVKQGIQRELAREGQVFFVHNRVHNIVSVADDVRALAPDARVIIGHGQMPPRELEQVMLTFMRREADILVCTTIIESGIDIPTANTMFINDAHMFGLAELHQLRGRVGRYKHRAYCYMMLSPEKNIGDQATKRLRAIEDYSMLGAGFKIAMRDLEIRGAGNLLGPEQSGHISAVGYELYCQLLEEAVSDLRNEDRVETMATAVDIGINGSIPRGYIASDTRRMEAYRRIARAESIDALRRVETDLASAYGEPPKSTSELIELAELRLGAASRGVRSIRRDDKDIVFRTTDPGSLDEAMSGAQGTLRVVGQPDAKGLTEVYYRPPAPFLEPRSLLTVLRRRLAR